MADRFLLLKGGYFFRPECRGYTASKAEAGVFTRAEAEASCAGSSEVSMLKYEHAEEVAPICTTGMAPEGMPSTRFQALMGSIRGAIEAGNYEEAHRLTFCD